MSLSKVVGICTLVQWVEVQGVRKALRGEEMKGEWVPSAHYPAGNRLGKVRLRCKEAALCPGLL